MGIAALVLGIIGVLAAVNPFVSWAGIAISAVALVFAVVARKAAARQNLPTGLATAGLALGIVGVAVGAMVFAACALCTKKLTDLGKDFKQEMAIAEQKAAAEAKVVHSLGETIPFDDARWVVSSAKDRGKVLKAGGKHGASAATEGRFVEVRFRITNLDKQEKTLSDAPKVVDSQGREFNQYADEAAYLSDGKSVVAAPLPPDLARDFVEIYELPADAKDVKFQTRAIAPFGAAKSVQLGF